MTDPSFTPNDTLIRKADLFTSQVDEDLVMLDEASGNYFGLNPIASKIWECLAKPICLSELVNILTTTYDVSDEQCKEETISFLNVLHSHQLLNVTNAE
ncbi:MAG: PqqD family protein [Chlamydiae bacterium]|nr:PqqD family protein [Chlamydiota bacterium]MBI3277680.1 PqqD family protein [Chlamydiota bacterium]